MSTNKESRRKFFQKTMASSAGLMLSPGLLNAKDKTPDEQKPKPIFQEEWRNKQEGMVYRKLGRTGFMVSEIVLGTFPFNTQESFPHLDKSIEMGINFFDTAYAYSNGEVEKTLGSFFKQSGKREKIFLATKLSAYYGMIDGYVEDIMKSLSTSKQEAIHNKVREMMNERTIMRPGYHTFFFEGQLAQSLAAYKRYLVLKEYGYKKEWKSQIKANAHKLLEGSLKRLQTDYVDVLYCPHGCGMPEMMDDMLMELFEEFKQKGMVRSSGVSFHNDVTNNLVYATEAGFYDVAMFAYNIANGAALDSPLYFAKKAGMGLIAMKVARLFSFDNQPKWREDKLNTAIPDKSLSIFAKSYLWALQNPNLSCCVSEMKNEEELKDNLQVIGKKVKLEFV